MLLVCKQILKNGKTIALQKKCYGVCEETVVKELHKEMLLVRVDRKREKTQGELGMGGLKQMEVIDNTKINALRDSCDAGRMHKSHKAMEY